MIDWRNVSLLGIDVGFSERDKTTGILAYRFGQPLEPRCVRFSADDRRAVLATDHLYDAIAIDGPLLPSNWDNSPRECERVLSSSPFSLRCRPAPSHARSSLKFIEATKAIAEDACALARRAAHVVEAFPNAFLGVLLPNEVFPVRGSNERIKRGSRSDVYYRAASRLGHLDELLDHLGWNDDAFRDFIKYWADPAGRQAHDVRAAIVCVLTAGCVIAEKSEPIGDTAGGYIHLPPRALWADWTQEH